MNVKEKLMYVQQNLKAPKGQYNSFGKYNYRSCEDIQEAVKPILAEVKAILLIEDELLMLGNRYYLKATAKFVDTEDGEEIRNVAYAREPEQKSGMDAAQVTGSCSSYARKYALNGLFCIDDAKDPDATNQGTEQGSNRTAAGSRNNKPTVTYVQQAHIATIRKQIERTGANEKAVCYQYRIARLEDMTMQQFSNAMGIFKKMPDKAPEEDYQMTLEGIESYTDEMPFR